MHFFKFFIIRKTVIIKYEYIMFRFLVETWEQHNIDPNKLMNTNNIKFIYKTKTFIFIN